MLEAGPKGKDQEQCNVPTKVGYGGPISTLNTMEVANHKKCKLDSSTALDGDIDLSLLETIDKSQSIVDLEHFADSKVDLHDDLQKLKILVGAPELYPELYPDLVNLNTIPSILNLLLLGFLTNPTPGIAMNPVNPGTWVHLSKSDFHKAKVKKKKKNRRLEEGENKTEWEEDKGK
ncbi:hypothetical protein SLEP1_g10895 [Rubroshorea leprosula]|uniref:Beta-catenin-like protein 1 N-terminal domain-containing protein n=1 Tax=Rubroshorea leprosula TaxID=152421 RepID=A0AAV5IKY5_9ROSI|nr:hypothetical protein SLEP1_g10895 [Rubroshorea leprosula]